MGWDIAVAWDLVTGGTSGIGRAAAAGLAGLGADVMITARDESRGKAAAEGIQAEVGVGLEVGLLDLSSLDSVRGFAAEYAGTHDRFDVLVNNAGVMTGSRMETPTGWSARWGQPRGPVPADPAADRPAGRRRPVAVMMTLLGPLLKSPTTGAAPIVLLATQLDDLVGQSLYGSQTRPTQPSRPAQDAQAVATLWEASERLAGLA